MYDICLRNFICMGIYHLYTHNQTSWSAPSATAPRSIASLSVDTGFAQTVRSRGTRRVMNPIAPCAANPCTSGV